MPSSNLIPVPMWLSVLPNQLRIVSLVEPLPHQLLNPTIAALNSDIIYIPNSVHVTMAIWITSDFFKVPSLLVTFHCIIHPVATPAIMQIMLLCTTNVRLACVKSRTLAFILYQDQIPQLP